MDVESECSARESVEDNEIYQEMNSHVDHPHEMIRNNGSCGEKIEGNSLLGVGKGKGVENLGRVNLPSLRAKSPGEGLSPSKGHGLKKWRRIKRDFVKDDSGTGDGSKILKRGLSGSENPTKPLHSSAEHKQNSKSSIGSVNMSKNPGVLDGFPVQGLSLDSKMTVGSAFAASTDSENSEGRSSKSSTAASMPKVRSDFPAVLGHGWERNKMKNFSGKNFGNTGQRVHQGKARIESSKKHRGERVKIEKENSQSSLESDSRSSNFVFMQGSFSATSNIKQSGKSINYDGENSDDAHASEQQFSEEVQTGYSKEKFGEDEGLSRDDLAADSSWEAREEKSKNHTSSSDRGPLVDSILTLQSVQEALEKEVRKLGEIGKDPTSLQNNSSHSGNVPARSTFVDPNTPDLSSSETLDSEVRQSGSSSLEGQVLNLTQNVKLLETMLEGAMSMLEVKESKISELEATLGISKSEETCIDTEVEMELEGFFKKKIETEVEYLILTPTLQKLRVAAAEQITLFEEQKKLAVEQARMLNKIGETKSKAASLKNQAAELEKSCGDIIETEEVSMLEKRVYEVTSCFFIQLILLLFVFWLFLSQLSPDSGMVVPT